MPKGDRIEELAFPRGRAAAIHAPGPPDEVETAREDAAALAAVHEEVGKVKALDMAERVAAGTAKATVEKALEQERQRKEVESGGKEGQLRAFKSYLRSLEDLARNDADTISNADETRLVLRLYRQEETGGPRPTSTYQTAATYTAQDALNMVDPDFEGRAQKWSEATGRFGRYRWRILGWAGGEQTLDTTYDLTTEAPPGYEPPAVPEAPREPLAPPDPMADMLKVLGVAKQFKDALGMGGGEHRVDSAALDLAKQAAASTARLEAFDRHREELRKLEKEHREDVKEADAEGYKRGVTDGRRAAEDELKPRIWELERQAETGKTPSLLEEAVRLVGGPEVVASIAKAAVANMTAEKPRQAPRPAPMHAPSAPQPQALAPLPEPMRREWREAMFEVEEALAILEESGDTSAETVQAKTALETFRAAGLVEGPLGNWWMAWQQGYREAAHAVLDTQNTGEGEDMDLDGMKALLARRLDEGATEGAILTELDGLTTPETRASWRKLLKWMPLSAAASMIADGRGDLEPRIESLLGTFLQA